MLVGILSKTFRLTAMFLLLFAAVEVLACDLLQSDDCYVSAPFQRHDGGTAPVSGDNCLCCCTHMVAAQPFLIAQDRTTVPAPPTELLEQPLYFDRHIDHPPQLF